MLAAEQIYRSGQEDFLPRLPSSHRCAGEQWSFCLRPVFCQNVLFSWHFSLFNKLIALFNSLLVYNTPGKECQEKAAGDSNSNFGREGIYNAVKSTKGFFLFIFSHEVTRSYTNKKT
jgi:hypothetical protein